MLNGLREILPLPDKRIDIDAAICERNQRTLGITFPNDFIEFGVTYGSGQIQAGSYTWEIYSACRSTYPAIVKQFVWIMKEEREAQEQFHLPIRLFPEPTGLIPFGNRDDVWFTWMTKGNPNDWTVVAIWEFFENGYHIYDMGFGDFLQNFLMRNTEMIGYTMEWAIKDIKFEPRIFKNPKNEFS